MSRLIADDRVIPIEHVERARSTLMDSHSLYALDTAAFDDPGVAGAMTARDFVLGSRGPWLAHVVQALVLHDVLLVDSACFEAGPTLQRAQEMFPDAIKPLFIRPNCRRDVAERINKLDNMYDPPPKFDPELWTRWQKLDSVEKPFLDGITAPRRIPPVYLSDPEVVKTLDRNKPIWAGFHGALNSMMTASRAHFYLELARALDIPLLIDPVRAMYLIQVVDRAERTLGNLNVAEKGIAEFSRMNDSNNTALLTFDVDIPAVPEYVLRVAQERHISLRQATIEVRNSANAQRFRGWCSNVVSLAYDGGLRAKQQYRELYGEFLAACELWREDPREGVRHRKRTIKLSDIPLVGKILAAAGMAEATIKDPVLTVDKTYRSFLFLNDLVRESVA